MIREYKTIENIYIRRNKSLFIGNNWFFCCYFSFFILIKFKIKFCLSIYCVAVYLNYLATGSRNGTINIWNLNNNSLEQSLLGHSGSIRCLVFISSHFLVSGSKDTTIKVWSLNNNSCTRTLYSHHGTIWAFCFKDSILISASSDNTVNKSF